MMVAAAAGSKFGDSGTEVVGGRIECNDQGRECLQDGGWIFILSTVTAGCEQSTEAYAIEQGLNFVWCGHWLKVRS